MTLAELKEHARAILSLEPGQGFSHKTFVVRSGGDIKNKVNVEEVHRSTRFRYTTVCNGSAYECSVTVECRETGALDALHRKILLSKNGSVFVFEYSSGDEYSFDRGAFVAPKMSTT